MPHKEVPFPALFKSRRVVARQRRALAKGVTKTKQNPSCRRQDSFHQSVYSACVTDGRLRFLSQFPPRPHQPIQTKPNAFLTKINN